jgi:DNA invertase Pin-like site-specific DNA recombinase
MTGKDIGYKRVSGPDQNPDRQLENVKLDKVFIDYATARNMDRPQLKLLLEFIREDDTLIVHSMDRLSRRVADLKQIVSELVDRKVKVRFIKEGLVFSEENSALSNLMLHMMGAFAEFEHAFILERQREGIAVAKKLGRYKGGKSLSNEKIESLKRELKKPKTKVQIAKDLGISRYTLYKYLKEGKEVSQ